MNGSQRTNIGIMTRSNTDFMPNWDVPGWDHFNVSGITNAFDCQAACDNEDKCRAWTFVSTRQVNNNCFLKTGIPYLQADTTCTSGIKRRQTNEDQLIWVYIDRTLSQLNPGAGRYSLAGTLWLQSQPVSNQCFLQLNIFIDHSIIEVFESEQGRTTITTRVYPEDDTARNLAVYVNQGPTTNEFITVNSLDSWILDSIWT